MKLPAQFLGVVIGARELQAQKEFTHGRLLTALKHDIWWSSLPWWLAFAMGIYAALMAELLFLGVLILVCACHLLRTHHRWIDQSYGNGCDGSGYRVDIFINEDGITENDRGVRATFDWSTMKRWAIHSDTLMIELANGLSAMIPAGSVETVQVPIVEIGELLLTKGVKQTHLPLPGRHRSA